MSLSSSSSVALIPAPSDIQVAPLISLYSNIPSSMEPQPLINFPDHELSSKFFEECEELTMIEQAFPAAEASSQGSRRDLESEFQLLRAMTETKRHRMKLRANSVIENKKNRYPQQSIYEHSRAILHDDEGAGYINANWVPVQGKKVIITQGPTPGSMADFEKMIAQEKVECVIMLCNIVESGRVRCIDYIEGKVTNSEKKAGDAIQISDVEITNEEGEVYHYKHVHYEEWPDHGVPSNLSHLDQLIDEALKYQTVVIHCSAGLGRSGLATCALSLKINHLKGNPVSIFHTARVMREHRFGSIQNLAQYSLLYNYVDFIHNQ